MEDIKIYADDHPLTPELAAMHLRFSGKTPSEVRAFLPKNHPFFLYRYLPPDINPEWLKSSLINGNFRFSSHKDFNDPFDMAVHLDFEANTKQKIAKFNQVIRTYGSHLTWKEKQKKLHELMVSPEFTPSTLTTNLRKTFEETGILCFTPTPKSLLMWSHYGKEHRGLVLQFEVAKDIHNLIQALPVAYVDEYPTFNWFKDPLTKMEKILLNKHPDWRYEGERRITRINAAHKYITINPCSITGLILGCKSDHNLLKTVKEILSLRDTLGLPHVQLYKAQQHPTKYKLSVFKA